MCGIAGIFAYDRRAPLVDRNQLQRTCDRLACRGPDGEGIWIDTDGKVALAHRRLAIIDLSPRGAQPMQSADGRHVIVFNGEIYNYRELRSQLEAKGRHFTSNSDTEVILQLYAERGEALVHALRGMFAFAIWDSVRKGVFLARDTFGIKPLYYSDDGRSIRFASEVKALLRGGGIDTSPDSAGHVGFFLWGHVPDPHTMYRGIRAVPAGTSMWCGIDNPYVISEFSSPRRIVLEAQANATERSLSDEKEELHAALLDSVRHHLIADVDIGVFLSAGIDSAVIAALVAETGTRPRTITLGFAEYKGTSNDETEIAQIVASRYGCHHTTEWVTRQDFENELPHFLDRMDQPTTDGVNTYFVSRAAQRIGLKVVLSGLGGDELFGGYPSFTQLPRLVASLRWMPGARTIGRAVRFGSAALAGLVTSPKLAGIIEYGSDLSGAYILRRGMFAPWELTDVLDPDLARTGWAALGADAALSGTTDGLRVDRLRISALEATWYMRSQLLRDTDWTGMTHGIEVRVPLVDTDLWRRCLPWLLDTASMGKARMADAPIAPLPPEVRLRVKTGFTTPVKQWVTQDGERRADRGLRGWARRIYGEHMASAQ